MGIRFKYIREGKSKVLGLGKFGGMVAEWKIDLKKIILWRKIEVNFARLII